MTRIKTFGVQPDPTQNNHPAVVDDLLAEWRQNGVLNLSSIQQAIWSAICALRWKMDDPPHIMEALEERKALGLQRYGVALQPFNGRNAKQDLFEELLDALIYAHQIEMEKVR